MPVKLSKLKANPDNPRIIKDDKFKKLCSSIQDFPKMMALRPMVVDAHGMVLGGNMRLKALQELKFKEVPDEWVKKASSLTPEETKRFIAADNIGFGDWDWDSLANSWDLEQLTDWGLDIPDFAFPKEALEDDYEIPDEISTDIVLGDLFEIGQHRLLCGDSTKADMVFTDPPYGMFLNADFSSMVNHLDFAREKGVKNGKKYNKVIGDNTDFKPELINTIFENFNYCKEIFLFGADYYSDCIPNKNNSCWVVWDKRLDESADKMYGSCFELIWSKAKHKRMIARVKWAGIFGTEHEPDRGRKHPTQKPIRLISWFFEYYSLNNKNIVADLYLGSGSTMVAAHQLNRKCYGMEIDPKYCQVIVDRMLKLDPAIEIKKNGNAYKQHIISELTA